MKKDAILIIVVIGIIAVLLIAANIPAAPIVDEFVEDYGTDYGAVGVWNFEEGIGTTTFDQSPYGNDGIITGATWAAGKYGEALTFDGNDRVTIPDSTSLDISDYITIEAWAKDPPFVAQIAQGPVWEPNTIAAVGEEIDWPAFWQKFKQYSLWDLEWYDGSEWISVKGDLDVQLSFPRENERKVNLVFDASHSGNYRLTFAISKVVKDYVTKIDKYQYELTYDDIQITFDWSDCKDISGLKFTHGIKDDLFWFRIRRDNVPLGAHVEIDPATVGTSGRDSAVAYGFQRKGFYAEGLFWDFYSDGTNAGWEFSNNGTTWVGAFTSIGACTRGYDFSVWFDGTYVHYTRYYNKDLFYRRGDLENDGSITWSAAEQTVYDGSSYDEYVYPCIAVDSSGYAWIGARSINPAYDYYPYVLKNNNTDGTWVEDFAYQLSAMDDSKWKICPVPLTGDKVYVIYCRDYYTQKGKLYDAGWGAEESDLADYVIDYGYTFSAVADGDDVHFVYNRRITNQIRHNIRVWGVGWNAADVLVQDAVPNYCGPALTVDPSTSDLYCFWALSTTDHVYYKKYSAGSWDADPTDWIDESTDDIQYNYLISSFYMDYGGYIGLLYTTKIASPYNVRFAFLDFFSPVNDACDSDPVFADDTYGWVNVTVSDPQGVANLDTVDIQVNTTEDTDTFILRWTEATAVFSEVSDPSGICTLDIITSTNVTIDADTMRVCFYFKITSSIAGDCDVKVTSTDDEAHTDVDMYSNEFEYVGPPVHKVIVEKINAYSLYINETNIVYGQINSTRVSYVIDNVTAWHYYSLVYDNITLSLGIDGEEVNSTALTGAITTNANDVIIGIRFLGEIDQVRIYNVAKTLGEIRNHYLSVGSHIYSGSIVVSDDFRILNTTFDERIHVDDHGVDLNHYYVLYSDFSHWDSFIVEGDKTDEVLNIMPPGLATQDRHFHRITLAVNVAPGGGKEFNITLTDSVGSMFISLTGAETSGYDDTNGFDWDVSAETLTLKYSQSAGGAVTNAFVTIKYHYKETP